MLHPMWPVFVNLESERMEPSSETARPPSHWPLVLVVAYLPLGYLLNSLPGSATIEMVSDRSLVLLDAGTLDDVAEVHLPGRVPAGFHGNWAPTA